MPQGKVVRWNAEKAFGFIRAEGSQGADVFFHIREYRGPATPSEGMAVAFEEVHVGGKGPRAVSVIPLGRAAAVPQAPAPRRPAPARGAAPRSGRRGAGAGGDGNPTVPFLAMLLYAAMLVTGIVAGALPFWIAGASFLLNLASFFAYWKDKFAAGRRAWRISENALHFWSLAGGWPGAWFAQRLLRHKSRKQSFRDVYWGTVVLHCAALAFYLWQSPAMAPVLARLSSP